MTVGDTEPAWTGLAPQTVTVSALVWAGAAVVAGLPTAIGVGTQAGGVTAGWVAAAAVVVAAAGTVHAYLRWRTTRYRIGPARVELRTGVLLRVRRSLPLGSVRSVDTDAGPLQRRFGLVVVRIGTGGHGGAPESTITINAVTGPEGERLHGLLLDGIRSAGGLSADAGHGRLASIDARWVRYAPFSLVTPVLGLLLTGSAALALAAAGVDPAAALVAGPWHRTVLTVLLVVLAATIAGAMAAVLLFTERWWHYRLDREPGGTLRVRRGLVSVRSVALEEGRLRGVVVDEPLGARLLGAGRLRAVCTAPRRGVQEPVDVATVLPTAPLALAHRLAAVLLGVRNSPTAAPLTSHPDLARRRREQGAAALTGVPAAAVAVVGGVIGSAVLLAVAAALVLVVVPAAVLAARFAYRNLGHGIVDDYLVTRSGLWRRRTAAIRRDAVTGWTATRGPLQRRDGLVTVTATTASGSLRAEDVAESDGLLLAAATTPELVAPLLEPLAAAEPVDQQC